MKPNQVSRNQTQDSFKKTKTNNIRSSEQVGTIYLYGVRIVSLIMDGKERLCLAQISNTLLKEYSYNEIHNRRVALGITCVQCTPVQVRKNSKMLIIAFTGLKKLCIIIIYYIYTVGLIYICKQGKKVWYAFFLQFQKYT